jgi:fructose-1,6-bisphosphatase/inositol monophosphatase family enzyme
MGGYQKELNVAKRLARQAGGIMLGYFNTAASDPTVKSDRTIVTKADTDINALVIEELTRETPGYSIWGEEASALIEGAKYTWVCDPVDGTVPFAKGMPISTFSLALVNEYGESVVGVVYDPFQDRLFEAVKGDGAFLNGARINVSEHAGLDGAYIDEELWINHEEAVSFDNPKDILNKAGAKVTTQCSAVIMGCFVAKGTYEAMIFGQGKPEDIAALAVIVTEAGGRVTDLFGNEQRYDTNIKGAIISNGKIHDELITVIKGINYTSKYLNPTSHNI